MLKYENAIVFTWIPLQICIDLSVTSLLMRNLTILEKSVHKKKKVAIFWNFLKAKYDYKKVFFYLS